MDIYQRLSQSIHPVVDHQVVLTHDQRVKGRLKTVCSNGEEIRLFLERGNTLMPGDLLQSECGKIVEVEAAVEDVMLASCDDWCRFSRACYHLGNRHVKIEVGERRLKLTPDHVLQQMLEQLGLDVTTGKEVFIPESGAYNQSHSHGHSHGHSHSHAHAHDHH